MPVAPRPKGKALKIAKKLLPNWEEETKQEKEKEKTAIQRRMVQDISR